MSTMSMSVLGNGFNVDNTKSWVCRGFDPDQL
jgi:hypothetical protein